ncbi:MAG: septum formation initiator family protein [Parcubacteria group bacterium]|jgi:cell division protein FtsB
MPRGLRRDKTKIGVKFFSGLFFLGGLTVLVLIGISLGKETYRKHQIQKEIDELQSQIEGLNKENSQLGDLLSYLSSSDYQEKEAREKLNLQKADEKMIVLQKEIGAQQSKNENVNSNEQAPVEDNSPNWQKWWKFFFTPKV